MMVPPAVQQLVEDALLAVENHPQHALLPIYRAGIYDAIGPLGSNPTSYQIRGRLALSCAHLVLGVWQRTRPSDDRAERLLSLAEQVLAGERDHRTAKKEADKAWDWLNNDYGERTEELPEGCFFALAAIVEAVYVVIGRDRFQDAATHENDTDADLDPWGGDTALWVATALAGPVWSQDQGNHSFGRLDFWRWWLTEAIPSAYAMVPSGS